MKHILFVDDEPKVLEGLENVLYPYSGNWEMSFAVSGEAALKCMDKEHVDIIVTDMRMPGMDGATLLRRVSEHHPNVVRIVLSGHAELEAALRAMPIAHQFLSKPCDAETLIGVLNRACKLQALINDEILGRLVGRIGELPARPKVYSELDHLLSDDQASLRDVAMVVEQDIGISTKILHVANTAFFSRGQIVTSVSQAVTRLGATFVKDLVLAVEVFRELAGESLAGFSIEALHEHSFLTASIAKSLLSDRKQAEEAFLAGTLHDVGKLILATALPGRRATAASDEDKTGPVYLCEEELVRVTHPEVGGYLLGLWGLPAAVIEAVTCHHIPPALERPFDVAGAVYVANVLAHEVETGEQDESLDRHFGNNLVVADRIEQWREMAASVYDLSA